MAEFAGCILMGGEVAKTVGSGVVNLVRRPTSARTVCPINVSNNCLLLRWWLSQEEWDADHDLLALAMTAVLAGAGISTSMATAFGLPVSATHGAISGLTAVALFERGPDAVNGSGLAFTVVGWVLSPLVGGLVAGGLSTLIDRHIFQSPNPAAEAHRLRPVLVAGTLGLIQVFLCSKGPTWLRLKWWENCIAFIITVAASALVIQKGGKLPMGAPAGRVELFCHKVSF
jgi:phosphate/sulfate permease